MRNMSLHGSGTKTSTALWKRGEYIENEKLLLTLSKSKFIFPEFKKYLAKPSSKRLLVSLAYYLHHLGDVLDK